MIKLYLILLLTIPIYGNEEDNIIYKFIDNIKIFQSEMQQLIIKLDNLTYSIQSLEITIGYSAENELNKIIPKLDQIADNINNIGKGEVDKITKKMEHVGDIITNSLVNVDNDITHTLQKGQQSTITILQQIEELLSQDNKDLSKDLQIFMKDLDNSIIGTIDSLRGDIRIVVVSIAILLIGITMFLLVKAGTNIYTICTKPSDYELLTRTLEMDEIN